MALLANQIMDARILSSMNGRVELSQFLRVTNQSLVSQVHSAQDDNRKNRKYPCPLCGKRFRFNSILSLHMRTHTGEKPFKCPYCDHRAAQKGNLKIHLRTHKQGILGKGRGRIREENRLLHELEERAILRDRQMRAGHVSQQQPPTCNIYQLQKSLSQTVLAQPPFISNTFVAESHPKMSTSPTVTSVHEEHLQPQPTSFRCSFCKGKFRKQQELERHIRILHKPYKCTLCEFAASQEEELISHVEITHITAESGAGQKPSVGASDKGKPIGEFPCEVCGQTFSQAWFLKGHMRKHKDSFEHCCQICGRRFKEPWFLKNHMKVHLNKLAAKGNLCSMRESSAAMSNFTQDDQSSLYSQYISHIHNKLLKSERADHTEYNQMMAAGGADLKVREMFGRMISTGQGPVTDAETSSLLGLNQLHPPLSSATMEYLQKLISNQDRLGNSSAYPSWQIVTPGGHVEQQVFTDKDQQQCSSYLPERCVHDDDGKLSPGDPDTKAISRSGSPDSVSHQGPTEMMAEAGNPGSSLEHKLHDSSPASGEKVYRCPVSSEYAAAQTPSLGFHLDRYHFPQWQNNREVSSPLQPSSSSSSPNPSKFRPRSREEWSTAVGQFLVQENPSESALLINKQFDVADKDGGVDSPLSSQTKKSQYEPLDLSIRPESVPSHFAPAVLAQMSGVFTNGVSSSVSRRLQSYSKAELCVKPAYQCDLLLQGTKEEGNKQNGGNVAYNGEVDFDRYEQDGESNKDHVVKWKMLKKEALESQEEASGDVMDPSEIRSDKLGQWGRVVAEASTSSLENMTPGQEDPLQHQGSLLSFLKSQGSLSCTPATVSKGEKEERDTVTAHKPFQCRYCSYSASQKGNLKTHVLCVHRKPFDNSLYPDRRLRRSHTPQVPSRLLLSVMGDNVAGRDQIGMTSLCGT